ncbi:MULTISPECIES: Uma2 family endonuclease [Microcoleaceae]|uniref:Uma2 family endonuclease n=1 Tax=Microcoleaceae TaxID=1892252 RepID=UPI0018825873|nr:Uma2 family endonuclease [Tychonema sp. LEGE 06208]MBE9164769.1 Uma2 family endonuclease [Tychonema sp. LEGE 06208]
MLLELRQLKIQPGQQLLVEDVNWQQLESILAELGESRASRISYSNGLLEIMVPLPEHEKAKEIIGDMVKLLLEARQIAFESLGSTTLKNERMSQAVEPDTYFYIQNQAAVIGKNRLDLTLSAASARLSVKGLAVRNEISQMGSILFIKQCDLNHKLTLQNL